LSGWYVTEIGRQPWLVQGVLKTADAVTPVASSHVGITLTIYLTLYVVLMVAYIRTLFFLAKKRLPEYQSDNHAQPNKEVNA
ncbi:cytochrome ubiquinol oxidase subunit I, partial [Streptococcus pyogenes]